MNINYLESCLKNLFCYLPDSEVQNVGQISKAMCKIAKNELQERDQKLEKLLSTYTLTHQFNIKNLKEAALFLLQERHSSSQCSLDQIELIVFLLSRGQVIIIFEGEPSLEKVSNENPYLKHILSLTKSTHKENLYAIGWDELKEAYELDALITQEFDKHNAQLNEKRYAVLLKADEKLAKFFPSGDELEELKRLATVKPSVLQPRAFSFSEYFTLFMKRTLAHGERFLSQEIGNPECTAIKENLDLIANLFNTVQSPYLDLQIKSAKDYNAMAGKTFPIRTKSLTNTLEGLDKFKSEHCIPNAVAILIAGGEHVNFTEEEPDDPNYDLTPIKAELTHHRAVILRPKYLFNQAETDCSRSPCDLLSSI